MTECPHDLDHASVLAAAKKDHEAVIELTRALVRRPSRAGIDPGEPVIDLLSGWMGKRGLRPSVLRDDTGAGVGLTTEIRGAHPGPRWVLDACLDTAPFGDEHLLDPSAHPGCRRRRVVVGAWQRRFQGGGGDLLPSRRPARGRR